MAFTYTPMSELEAVNNMLRGVGEMPISSLDEEDLEAYPEADLAYKKLYEVSRTVQTECLDCNTEYNYPLTPDGSNNLVLPANTLFVEAMDGSNYVARSGKLYDKDNHTFSFTKIVKVKIALFLPYEDLPQHVRDYVTLLAKTEFQTVQLGSDSIDKQLEDDLARARAEFRRGEIRSDQRTMLWNYGTYEIVRRRW